MYSYKYTYCTYVKLIIMYTYYVNIKITYTHVSIVTVLYNSSNDDLSEYIFPYIHMCAQV